MELAHFMNLWCACVFPVTQGYLPRDLYNLDSRYGSESELRECISVFNEHGIKVIADIVINHRCASQMVRQFRTGWGGL